ncbi:MAG: PilZ domain-containing protein [Sphingobium sp.]
MSRIDQRADTDLTITILRGGKQGRAQLRNLSRTGASASAPFPPGLNEDVQMICRGQVLDCKVAWAQGRVFGLSFVQRLSEDKLQTMLRASRDAGST